MLGMKLLMALAVAVLVGVGTQMPFVSLNESLVHGGRQLKGLVSLDTVTSAAAGKSDGARLAAAAPRS